MPPPKSFSQSLPSLFPRAFELYKARTRAPPLHLELLKRPNSARASITLERHHRARASSIPPLHWHHKSVPSFALALQGHRACYLSFSHSFSLTHHHQTLAVWSPPPSRAPHRFWSDPASVFYLGEFASSFSFVWYWSRVKWWPETSDWVAPARFLAAGHGGRRVVHLSRRPVLFLHHLMISAVHFKSDSQKLIIPLCCHIC
jgi:hypothetical protein